MAILENVSSLMKQVARNMSLLVTPALGTAWFFTSQVRIDIKVENDLIENFTEPTADSQTIPLHNLPVRKLKMSTLTVLYVSI